MATCYCPVIKSQSAGPGVALEMVLMIPESSCGATDSKGKYIDYCSSLYTWNSGPAQMETVMLALVPGLVQSCTTNGMP
jgi:hypothetical protein